MSVSEMCVDNAIRKSYVVHKMAEYNAIDNDINDNIIVVVNMKNSGLFFGYKKDGNWYDENDQLVQNCNDIISFFDFPIPAFFAKRKQH